MGSKTGQLTLKEENPDSFHYLELLYMLRELFSPHMDIHLNSLLSMHVMVLEKALGIIENAPC